MTASSSPPTTDKARPARKGPGFLARALALLLAILFILALPLALLAFDTGRVVFNPALVKSIVADEVVNHDLIPVGLEWFSDRRAKERVEKGEALVGEEEPDVVLLMSFLDREDWRTIKDEVLTPEVLTGWVSDTVDGTYAWIDSQDAVPQITWTAQPFKDRVNSEHGRKAILVAYEKLPPCTQAEIEDFEERLDDADPDEEVLYNLCEFPDPYREDQISDYANAVQNVVDNIPDEFPLTRELQNSGVDPQGAGAEALKQQLRLLRLLASLAWLLPVVLIVLVTALAVRSVRGWTRWWGIPLLAGGLLALLPALVYGPLITSLLASGPLSETPDLVRVETTRAITRLAGAIFQPMLIQAAIITAAGIVLVALSTIGRRKIVEKVV
jgi:hypothetical protein